MAEIEVKLKRLPVSDKAEELRMRLREIPLTERLTQIPDRISKMCSQGRPPRMSIPVQWDDDDWFITYTGKDAEARIAEVEGALRKIAELDDCGCEHDTENCCAKVDYPCGRCFAAAVLKEGE